MANVRLYIHRLSTILRKMGFRYLFPLFFIFYFLFFLFFWFSLPTPLFSSDYSTVLLDRNQDVLGVMVAADQQLRFQEVESLPAKYLVAVMTFEDQRFLLHAGVDWLAFGRALIQNVISGRVVSGGSTLSMQVVRLSRGNPPRTVPEKLREMFLTLRLEAGYSKAQILRLYASHAPFGGNIVGVRAAALKYFNRQPGQLSWAEAALLAVLPNAPALIFPGKNDGLLKHKRDALLEKLCRSGEISPDNYRLAIEEPLPRQVYDINCIAPHLLARAYREKPGTVCHSTIDRNLHQ